MTYVDEYGTEVSPPDWQVDSLRRLGLITKVSFDCPVCGFEAATRGGLSSHMRTHEEE